MREEGVPEYPLGKPIRPPKPEQPEWIADDPSRPHIQRNTKTGMWRNAKPTPPAETLYPWFGVPGKAGKAP